jgi:hypothetical protein
MKKINVPLIFAFALMISFLPMVTKAGAETMNWIAISYIERRETVVVTQTEGVMIGVIDRKGLGMFEDGEVFPMSCRGTFDTKKGWQGYTSIIFQDGSTLLLSWKGPTSSSRPGDGKMWEYGLTFEYVEGTGRFEGIKGSGTFTGKQPEWDADYKAKGFAYYDFKGNYTLPPK